MKDSSLLPKRAFFYTTLSVINAKSKWAQHDWIFVCPSFSWKALAQCRCKQGRVIHSECVVSYFHIWHLFIHSSFIHNCLGCPITGIFKLNSDWMLLNLTGRTNQSNLSLYWLINDIWSFWSFVQMTTF